MNAALPLLVIGGYLGAGKTTLINHLLRHANGLRMAVLVNDFGDLPIDADLIVGQHGEVLSLAGGCICCSFGADLVGALHKLLRPAAASVASANPVQPTAQALAPPDLLLIECSGVGLPAAVARTALLVPGLALQGIVGVLDASSLREQASDRFVSDVVRQQLAQADLLLLNKLDLLTPAEKPALQRWLQAQGLAAPVLQTQGCELAPEVLLGPWGGPGPLLPSRAQQARNPASDLAAAAKRRAETAVDSLFETETLHLPGPQDVQALAAQLTAAGSGVLRAKAWLQDQAGKACVLQVVGRRASISAAPSALRCAAVRPRLVVLRLKRGP